MLVSDTVYLDCPCLIASAESVYLEIDPFQLLDQLKDQYGVRFNVNRIPERLAIELAVNEELEVADYVG